MADRFIAHDSHQREREGAGFAKSINNCAFRSNAMTIKLERRLGNLANSLSIISAFWSNFDCHIR